MEAGNKRKIQLFFLAALVVTTARTLWVFHERSAEFMPEKPALKERNPDDYVYLRPSHAHDLESARAAIKGKTVWVHAGNAVAFYPYAGHVVGKKEAGVLPPLAPLDVRDVVMSGDQMMAVFAFMTFDPSPKTNDPVPEHPPPGMEITPIHQPPNNQPTIAVSANPRSFTEIGSYAAPIGVVKHGDATIVIDDIFFLEDPHKLYNHWTKDQWAAVERHEITQGMTEAMAAATMGVGHAPESGEGSGDYGNRTLVFTDPAHADKPVTVRFVGNAAVSVSK
jgi:hypothetical protein